MKISVAKCIFCLVLLLPLCLLPSCSASDKRAEDILYRICESLSLPAGQTYLSEAEEGSDSYLSENTAQSLYGESHTKRTFPLIEDYAIYISSFAEPCEVAVIKCYSRSDTDAVAEMCLERADEISVILKNTDYAARRAKILTRGNYVVMLLCEDSDKAADIARRALK
ncbi:MAG: DUF4358 domain-containing protein [Clostridia bacterium]|nr:DUF4358 domain-containing protein [Clostridia bacterium]